METIQQQALVGGGVFTWFTNDRVFGFYKKTLSAVFRAEKQTRPLTFPMTLTQIPTHIDQQKVNMNGTCPFVFFTMPHSFQSDRGRTENHKLGLKGLFLMTKIPSGPHVPFFLI